MQHRTVVVPSSSRPVRVLVRDLAVLKERNGLHWVGNTAVRADLQSMTLIAMFSLHADLHLSLRSRARKATQVHDQPIVRSTRPRAQLPDPVEPACVAPHVLHAVGQDEWPRRCSTIRGPCVDLLDCQVRGDESWGVRRNLEGGLTRARRATGLSFEVSNGQRPNYQPRPPRYCCSGLPLPTGVGSTGHGEPKARRPPPSFARA